MCFFAHSIKNPFNLMFRCVFHLSAFLQFIKKGGFRQNEVFSSNSFFFLFDLIYYNGSNLCKPSTNWDEIYWDRRCFFYSLVARCSSCCSCCVLERQATERRRKKAKENNIMKIHILISNDSWLLRWRWWFSNRIK